MNSQTSLLLEEVNKHANAPASESCGLFSVLLTVDDADSWGRLRAIQASGPALEISVRVSDPHGDDGYDLLDNDFYGEPIRCRFNAVKFITPGKLRFFTVDGLNASLRQETDKFESVSKIVIAEPFFKQNTIGLSFEQWLDSEIPVAAQPLFASPRRVVNDMTGKGVVPKNVATWIVAEGDPKIDDAFRSIASRQLALCIPEALSTNESSGFTALVKTSRKLSAEIEVQQDRVWNDVQLFISLCNACKWLYAEDREVEVKQALLTSELSRVWRLGETWCVGLTNILDGSLDAAKIAYRLHVQTKGVDAFKLMSDLRKGLTEDVRSLSTSTASLSAGLWRDAAVAFGVVVIKVSTTSVGPWLLYLAAAYLLASCYFTCRAASNSVNSTIKNEKSFRSLLYRPLLADQEYEELAGKHYRDAVEDFEWFRLLIITAYAVAAIALVYTGLNAPISSQTPFMLSSP